MIENNITHLNLEATMKQITIDINKVTKNTLDANQIEHFMISM